MMKKVIYELVEITNKIMVNKMDIYFPSKTFRTYHQMFQSTTFFHHGVYFAYKSICRVASLFFGQLYGIFNCISMGLKHIRNLTKANELVFS